MPKSLGLRVVRVLAPVVMVAGLGLVAPPQAQAAPASTTNYIAGSSGGTGITVLCRDAGFACTTGGYDGTSSQYGVNGWASWQYWQHGSAYGTNQRHNCTTYAAYKLMKNGYAYPGWTSNATYWDTNAWSRGVNVDQTPAVGAIAQWNRNVGHVAYVEVVTATYVEVTSDNYGGGTNRLRIYNSSPHRPDNYIHFKDVPTVVDPGWTQVSGWASDVAMATITGGWEMFHIGGNGTIFRRKAQNGVTTGWQAISGPRAKRIAVTTSTDGRVELFYIGLNDAIYHHWESTPGGDISRWEALGGYAKEIAAARSGSGWEVFHVGGDNAIYRARQSNHAWQKLVGTWAYDVAAATSRDGRVELFHIAGGRNVMHAWQSSPGSGFGSWVDVGGWKTDIAASSVGNGEYEVYAVGGSGSIWRNAPWSGVPGWQRLSGTATRMAAARHPDGRVEVMHMNSAGNMYHAWQKRVGGF